VDRRRLADVRAGTAGQQHSSGSGYLVGRKLVLTCRHVIEDKYGRTWPRLEVRLGHPADGPPRPLSATVAWVHPNPAADFALLQVQENIPSAPPVRWGRFAGASPLPYTGLGFPDFAEYDSGRGVEQLSGAVSPLAVGAHGGLVLDQGAAPKATSGRAWPGISGTAVFCGGLLTAVVTTDDQMFGNRRLHAVPVSLLAGEHAFATLVAADTGSAPTLEPVELAQFLLPPMASARAGTPGSLLAPAVEAVDFVGRRKELATLNAWRDGRGDFSALLVAGEGGQGKTRLARQYAALSRQAGWAAGFLVARISGGTGQEGSQGELLNLAARVREATGPVLLVVDYAETRPDEVTALVDALAGVPLAHRVRLLLLSRAVGAWWNNLAEILGPAAAQQVSLEPLTEAGHDRREARKAAVTGLARRLEDLPEAAVEQPVSRPWGALADDLAESPPDLNVPQLGNALSLQVSALVSLLEAAAGAPLPTVKGEADLVRHERSYLRRAAARRGLFSHGVLSDRTDPDERITQVWRALERALAAAIMLGPCSPHRARAISALADTAHAEDVAGWLAAMYPLSDGDAGIGAVQPDRLAELLLGPIITAQPSLPSEVGALAETIEDAYRILFGLVRTAAHPGFDRAARAATDLIVNRPIPFAAAAPVLAAGLPQPGPLHEGLGRLGRQDPQAFKQVVVHATLGFLPRFSLRAEAFSAALTAVLAGVIRPLAEENPDTYLGILAAVLDSLGVRLWHVGQREAGLGAIREAVEILRQLADASPDEYMPQLAAGLANLGGLLGEAGQREAGLRAVRDAVELYRPLAEAIPDAHLGGLAGALTNLGSRLWEAGQREAGLGASREAVELWRQLAEADRDQNLPNLAWALNNMGGLLGNLGRREEALTLVQESHEIFRQLAEADPDAYLPEMAKSLNNQGVWLRETRQWEAALRAARESVEIHRQLAETNPDAYLPYLAGTLRNLGILQVEAGNPESSLTAALEAVEIWRQLAEADPVAYLPDLAFGLQSLGFWLGQGEIGPEPVQESIEIYRQLAEAEPVAYLPSLASGLCNLGAWLGEKGDNEEALRPAQESVEIYRQLAEADPGAHLQGLAKSLNGLGHRLTETRQQEALEPVQESVEIWRQLAEADPDICLPYLASALSDLRSLLIQAGQRELALAPELESVDVLHRLTEADPNTYLPALGAALTSVAGRLRGMGQQEPGLAVARESVRIYRQLAEADPGAYLPELAAVLSSLAIWLGHGEAALDPNREAVAIYRQLAEENPGTHLHNLAAGLSNLAAWLGEVGQDEAALEPGQEAVDLFRQLAEGDPDVILPELARSLISLAGRLWEAGQRESALARAQESADLFRRLAEADPDTYLPELALGLSVLGGWLWLTGQRESALAPTRELVDLLRYLPQVESDTTLPNLIGSLANLSGWLSENGRAEEIDELWESALAALPDDATRHVLLIEEAACLLRMPEPGGGVGLLVKILTEFPLTGRNEYRARAVLREHWRSRPHDVENSWQESQEAAAPAWLFLTNDQISAVADWISSSPWRESRLYLDEHAELLLDDMAPVILDELALIAPAHQVNMHRHLLEGIRALGAEAAYRPLILSETADQWEATADWDASRAFLEEHPELLSDETAAVMRIRATTGSPEAAVHDALLTLARGPAGTEGAYQVLQDLTSAQACAASAVAARDAERLRACAAIEEHYHHHLMGILHLVLAWLIEKPAGPLPDSIGVALHARIAACTNSEEVETARTQFASDIGSIGVDKSLANQLLQFLGLPRSL
jgi:hypothetical protein